MKEKIGQIKEFADKLEKKTKIKIVVGTIVLIAVAVVAALILNQKAYETLYMDVNTDEATQIVGKLQEQEIDYQYDGAGNIKVLSEEVDKVKANLASEGYPKSGFTYDVFTSNASMMTTDSDKQTYKIYDLQNRIGATVSLFEGVKDTKVTIALGETKKYALDDSNNEQASASVVMIMEGGGQPTEQQAAAVQNLVSKSIPGLTIENVAVFDGNGNDVSSETGGDATSTKVSEEIAQIVESQIEQKVLNVLKPIYGTGNVKVSPKAKINMETLVRETIDYTTPEKINENDKTGIMSNESGTNESSGAQNTAGGTAGTETNADVPQNNAQTGNTSADGYKSESYDRQYLVNQIKEQGQVPAGAIEDLTMSVVVNGSTLGSLQAGEIRALIGNAAGITVADQEAKITVVSTPFYKADVEETTKETTASSILSDKKNVIIIAAIAAAAVILFMIIMLLVLKKKKKNRAGASEAENLAVFADNSDGTQTRERESIDREVIDMQNEKGLELRQNVRDFTEQSPEIAAQMLRNWMNGESADGSNP